MSFLNKNNCQQKVNKSDSRQSIPEINATIKPLNTKINKYEWYLLKIPLPHTKIVKVAIRNKNQIE